MDLDKLLDFFDDSSVSGEGEIDIKDQKSLQDTSNVCIQPYSTFSQRFRKWDGRHSARSLFVILPLALLLLAHALIGH
jgi:hypothetical protein